MGRKGSKARGGKGRPASKVKGAKSSSVEPYSGIPSSLYDDGPIGLCYLDLDLRYLHVNKWLAEVNGVAAGKHLGRTVGEVISDVAPDAEQHLRQVIETGEPIEAMTVDVKTRENSGQTGTFQYNFYPVKSSDGTLVGASCAVRDVTEQQADPALREADESASRHEGDRPVSRVIADAPDTSYSKADAPDSTYLVQIENQLAQSTAALEAANRELDSFSDALTHDLKGALLIVTNFGHHLLETLGTSVDKEHRDDLKRISAASQHMMLIIDDLHDLTFVNRRKMSRATVDLSAMGQKIVSDLSLGAPDREVKFEVEPGIEAYGDPTLVRMLLTNLLQNAWKYTEPGDSGWVELGVVEDEDDVPIYHVRDNGIGFDNADREIIFQAFKRLHTRWEFSGSGLGLATVERIVSRHGGEVWADGVPGEGAVFRFTLGS